jgi:hypothetical protein
MGLNIYGGNSGKPVDVNDENELLVRAIVESELEHSSAKNGQAYSWVSNDTDIDVNDTRLFIKNTGNTPLVLDRATFLPSNVACTWSINIGKATTTPTGTEITGVNLSQSGKVAEAIAYDDETNVADGSPIDYVHKETTGTYIHSLDGVILQKGHYIQFNFETEVTSGRVVVVGHFENPD